MGSFLRAKYTVEKLGKNFQGVTPLCYGVQTEQFLLGRKKVLQGP